MVTSAQVQILNDGPRVISINATSHHLHNDLATPLVVAAGVPKPAPPASLQADESTNQSSIDVSWANNSIKVDLGRFAFHTGATEKKSSAGQCEVVCAPTDPFNSKGWDFFFWFLASHCSMQNVVNSVLDANVEALAHFINSQHIKVPIGPIELKISNVIIKKLECTYAAISKQGKRAHWTANVVLKYTGRIQGEFVIPFDGGFKHLQVMLSLSIDTSDPAQKLKVTTTRMQFAVEEIDGISFVGGPASYYGPGYANTNYNRQILTAMDEVLNSIIPLSLKIGVLEQWNPEEYVKPPVGTIDHRSWMSAPHIQAKTLSQLKLPGTHDSAAYAFEFELSTVLYNYAWIKNVHPESAPPNHDFKSKDYYIGQKAYRWLMEQVYFIAQAHDASKTIQKQLEDGIRVFDLRVYYDERVKDYYTFHGLRGASFAAILEQIRTFLAANDKAAEFAIFRISHNSGTFSNDKAGHAAKVAQMVKEKLGQWLWMPSGSDPSRQFDFQQLGPLTLSSITNGSSKILWIDIDNCEYPHSILNVAEHTVYPDTKDPNPPAGLYGKWLTMTPEEPESAGCILLNCYNASKRDFKILQWASRKLNGTARKVLQEQPHINMVCMDWYTEADKELPVDVIIAANS